MTKDEIMDKLTELGIEFDPQAKKAELEALLPAEDATPPAGETGEGLEIPEGATIEASGNPSRRGEKAVDVMDMYGHYIRTYEESRHGKDFRAMAEEFVRQPDHAVRGYQIVEPANPERVNRN